MIVKRLLAIATHALQATAGHINFIVPAQKAEHRVESVLVVRTAVKGMDRQRITKAESKTGLERKTPSNASPFADVVSCWSKGVAGI
jgi:hypothetical protein